MHEYDYEESDNWPVDAQREVRRLRSECARMRVQRNEARQELARVTGRPAGMLTPLETARALRGGAE